MIYANRRKSIGCQGYFADQWEARNQKLLVRQVFYDTAAVNGFGKTSK
jgi:hypothetical protein